MSHIFLDQHAIDCNAGKSVHVYLRGAALICEQLSHLYLCLHTWCLGSMTQCVRNHSLFARLIHDFDWRVYQFFLPVRLALVLSGLCREMFQWLMIRHDHGYLSLDVGLPATAGLYNSIYLSVGCCIISLCCH